MKMEIREMNAALEYYPKTIFQVCTYLNIFLSLAYLALHEFYCIVCFFAVLYKTLQFKLPIGVEFKNKIAQDCLKCVYSIGEFPESVNGHKYWISNQGAAIGGVGSRYAIWYMQESKLWIIGFIGSLGSDKGFVVCGPDCLIANNDDGMYFETLPDDRPITKFPYAKKSSFIVLESKEWQHLCDINFAISEFSERKQNCSTLYVLFL